MRRGIIHIVKIVVLLPLCPGINIHIHQSPPPAPAAAGTSGTAGTGTAGGKGAAKQQVEIAVADAHELAEVNDELQGSEAAM